MGALQSKWKARGCPGGNGAGNKMPTGLRNETGTRVRRLGATPVVEETRHGGMKDA